MNTQNTHLSLELTDFSLSIPCSLDAFTIRYYDFIFQAHSVQLIEDNVACSERSFNFELLSRSRLKISDLAMNAKNN